MTPTPDTMPEPGETTHLVTAVFRAWQQAGIDFIVLRNYERLPHFTTNDIDVLVEPARAGAAEQTLLAAARHAGFRLHNRVELASLALYLSNPQSGVQAHFDLFSCFKWRAFHFLDCRTFFARKMDRGLFAVPHPAHEAATSLLQHLVYHGHVKEKYRPAIANGFRADPAAGRELLTATCGPSQAGFLVAAGALGHWREIELRAPALRRTLVIRQLTRHPARTAASLAAYAARLARRAFRPAGLTVALCGTDGSGKSTAATQLPERLRGTFSPPSGRLFHWKPPLFSAKRRAARGPVTNPHAQPPRGPLASLLFFACHWLEFFLGWFCCVWPPTLRGGLVLIDRFYYDFFVDQRRYRLRLPHWLVRLGYALLPKPGLVLLLDAPVEVLQSRKQEVPPAETQRQRLAYRHLIERLPNGRIIDAAQPPGRVAADLEKAVLDFMAQRARQRSLDQPPIPIDTNPDISGVGLCS